MTTPYLGGSFAPPLPAPKIAAYRALASLAEPAVREAMTTLCDMMQKFQETPRSKMTGSPHPVGVGIIVPLEPAEVKRIWDVVPWEDELNVFAARFDRLDPVAQRDLRNAAFHLLWYGYELAKDREPISTDQL